MNITNKIARDIEVCIQRHVKNEPLYHGFTNEYGFVRVTLPCMLRTIRETAVLMCKHCELCNEMIKRNGPNPVPWKWDCDDKECKTGKFLRDFYETGPLGPP